MIRPTLAAALAGGVAVAGLAAGYVFTRNGGAESFAQCRGSQVAGADIGGPFELVDGDGRTVTDADVITEPALLYFGYTFCPDVCPLDTARNAVVVDILADEGRTITPVFISVDPKRDTPDVVGAFAEAMHERMIGLTGSPEQVQAASRAYRTYYRAHDDGTDPYYLVDHSTFSYFVLPEHGFVEFYRREATPEAMAESIACFIDATG